MAEKKDVAMNTFPQVTDAEYIYAEAADGSQKKISKVNLLASVFQDMGRIPNGGDLNNYSYGTYSAAPEAGSVVNGPSFSRFILICLKSVEHYMQIAVNVHPGGYAIQYRTSYNYGTNWTAWKSISIT